MSEAKHSPTPWQVGKSVHNDGAISVMNHETRIARIDIQILAKKADLWRTPCAERDANAAFIVRAVNAHADMLAALHACAEYFDSRADADCDDRGPIANEEMRLLNEVEDAIRKAESGP